MVSNLKLILFFLVIFSVSLWAGQNSGAGIRFDLDSATIGNQNLTNIEYMGSDELIRIDVYVINASNLDNYEIYINYNSNDLLFINGEEDSPVTSEKNFLKKNGGSTLGFTCKASSGVINCANTLLGDQEQNTPDGEGLLVSLQFRSLVECPGILSFGSIDLYDNVGIIDLAADFGDDVTLPVALYSFSLLQQGEVVLITWETASELNNIGFNIWRSIKDSISYSRLNSKFIEGKGNTSRKSFYQYVDDSVEKDTRYYYKLEQIDFDGTHSLSNTVSIYIDPSEIDQKPIPTDYVLHQNYPNPFNPLTAIGYQLSVVSDVELNIYNLIGQKIATLVSEKQNAGYYQVEWDASYIPSGVYYYILKTPQFTDIKKMILLR